MVLVDSSITHNFINPWVAQKTWLKVEESKAILVKIANGEVIRGEGQCNNVAITLQGNHFNPSFYLLKLRDCDVVL